jgi:hypothetical protein
MRCTFGYSLREIAAASLLSCFIAGGICVAGPSTANNAAVLAISVNRTVKGDRATPALLAPQSDHNSTSTGNAPSRKETLLGCEPAFSPVTDPARAHNLRHCVT